MDFTMYKKRKTRVDELIRRGKVIREKLVPIWAEYRKFHLDAARFNGEAWPLCKLEMQGLRTPDIDFVLDLLLEQEKLLNRQIDYDKHLDRLDSKSGDSEGSICLSTNRRSLWIELKNCSVESIAPMSSACWDVTTRTAGLSSTFDVRPERRSHFGLNTPTEPLRSFGPRSIHHGYDASLS
jgi:hypothetical protein